MPEERPPLVTLSSKLSSGKHHRGAPKKRYKDQFWKIFENLNIWEILAQNRINWCKWINESTHELERNRKDLTVQLVRLSRRGQKPNMRFVVWK